MDHFRGLATAMLAGTGIICPIIRQVGPRRKPTTEAEQRSLA